MAGRIVTAGKAPSWGGNFSDIPLERVSLGAAGGMFRHVYDEAITPTHAAPFFSYAS
jgi:hypothetical protein